MKLAVVVSKGEQNEVGRIYTDSPVADVLRLLELLGAKEWELTTEGPACLFYNGPDVYVAVGPLSSRDEKSFLKKVDECRDRECLKRS